MQTLTEALGVQAVQDAPAADITNSVDRGIQMGVRLATAQDEIQSAKTKVAAQKEQLAQAQMTGLGNKLRASLFSADKNIFESRLKQAENYALQANIPFNAQAIRDIYANEQTRLVAQRGISDVMTGRVPMKPEEFLNVMGSQDGLYNFAEQGLTSAAATSNKLDAQLEVAQTKAEYAGANRKLSQDLANERFQRQQDVQVADKLDKAKSDFDRAVKDDLDAMTQASKGEALLLSGGTISSEAAKSTIARMFEKGVLTDADVARLAGGRGLMTRGEQLLQKLYDGKLTEENKNELLKITQTLKPLIAEKIRNRANREATAKEKAFKTLGISKSQFQDVYAVDELLGAGTQPPQTPAVAPAAPKAPAFNKDAFIKAAKAQGKSDAEIQQFLSSKGL